MNPGCDKGDCAHRLYFHSPLTLYERSAGIWLCVVLHVVVRGGDTLHQSVDSVFDCQPRNDP
jgi:hypothetical protein